MRLGRERPRKAGERGFVALAQPASMRLGRERPRKVVCVMLRAWLGLSFNEAGARTPQKVFRELRERRNEPASMRLGRERPRKKAELVRRAWVCLLQ